MGLAKTQRSRAASLLIFPSSLGWMAVVHCGRVLTRLAFGYPEPDAAAGALDTESSKKARPDDWERQLIGRLQAYACGRREDFGDLAVDLGPLSRFQRRVYRRCRQIPYGRTLTYGRLAVLAGSPRAARAVGSCMARNPVPLVIPCHRVIRSGGEPGGYSAPGGTRLKQRLLELEAGRPSGPG